MTAALGLGSSWCPRTMLWCQDSSAGTRTALVCPMSCVSCGNGENPRRSLGCQTCPALVASREAAVLQAKASSGLARRVFEELPRSTAAPGWSLAPDSLQVTQGFSRGAWILELLILCGENPKCHLVHFGFWLAPSRRVPPRPLEGEASC